MKKMIRLTAFAVAVLMIASCLFSCNLLFGADPAEVLKEADAALATAPYTVRMGIEYSSEDEDMASAIEKLSNPKIELKVDGESFSTNMSLNLDGRLASYSYTVVDGTVYYDSYEEGENEIYTLKKKSAYTDEMKKAIIDSFGDGANIRADDFDSVSAMKAKGSVVVTCSDIKRSAIYGVTNSLQDKLLDIGAIVSVKDASLVIQITDAKYASSAFICTYVITTSTDVYTVTMTLGSVFDYDTQVEISAPTNADEYVG